MKLWWKCFFLYLLADLAFFTNLEGRLERPSSF